MRVSKFKELANLEKWKEMIASRVASNLSVSAWCKQNNLTEQQYYYRLNKVRQAVIEDAEVSDIAQLVRVPSQITVTSQPNNNSSANPGMVIRYGLVSIEIRENESISRISELVKELNR